MTISKFKGSASKLKSLSIELEEKEQEHGYVKEKIEGFLSEIIKMKERIEYYQKKSLPEHGTRLAGLAIECGALRERIVEITPMAESEKAHEAKQAKIAELEAELRKLMR